jgi:DNA primase
VLRLKFSDIYRQIDYDALYAELGWEPKDSTEAEDKGYCLDLWNMHNNGDTTGKLAINRDKGVYNCWVCGGGTILSLVMEAKHLDEQKALDWLSQFVNPISKESSDEFYARVERQLRDDKPEPKPLPHFNERVLDRWLGDYHPWLARRGVSHDVATYFKVGYSPAHRKYHPRNGEYVGEAIILPHFWQGRLVGWQERWLSETPSHIGKYTNTMDFPRHETLWGFDFAMKQERQPIVVESVMTALFLITEGYPAIATFGAELTNAQLVQLRGFVKGIILAPDNDGGGAKFLATAKDYLSAYIPLLQIEPVKGAKSDLGDLSAAELSAHLRNVEVLL